MALICSIICLWHKNFLSAKKGSNGHGVVDFHETTTVSQPDLVLSKPLTTNELENPWSGWPSYITRYKKMWNHLPKQSSYVKFNHCLNCSIILLTVICIYINIYTLHICSLYIKIMHYTLYKYIYIYKFISDHPPNHSQPNSPTTFPPQKPLTIRFTCCHIAAKVNVAALEAKKTESDAQGSRRSSGYAKSCKTLALCCQSCGNVEGLNCQDVGRYST